MNKGYLLVILAAMLWGTTGTSQGIAPVGLSSSVIGAFRILLGGIILFAYAIIRKDFPSSSKWNLKITFLGIVTVALYQLSFFYGVKEAGVAVGTMVGIGSAPIFAGILSKVIYREKLGRVWLISTLSGVLGIVFIGLEMIQGETKFNITGIMLCLGAGLSYTLYTLSSKELLREHSANAVMGVLFLGGALFLSPVLFFNDLSPIFSLKGMVVVIHLGVFATAVSYFLFARGLKLIKVSETATLSLAEPLTATFLGITVLGESPAIFSIIGMVLIFLGLLILVKN
ncbi:MAG: EamA family transporter [Deferribacterales bacterium]|jgi:DME family drug/metabolite transporter|uniref:DMT family transporter n=1 Tax=Deferrivibrio essentukiensis TaxID=2880922 RepID=UPI0019A62F10|nr:EamA family transporter [Deferrivibrio essentukiensis]MBC7195842.1 EamA family transporter [Deferribacterales bacterium]MCB4204260.1 EamA family transporter [Deferrivibrio essentukiensis]MDK2791738.1 drug/metabolite transporter, family [Deferribacteres bacterium]